MSEMSEVRRTWLAIVSRWPLVLALTLIGGLVMVGIGLSGQEKTVHRASSKVRIAIASVPNMPTVDLLVAYAAAPEAKRSVEESIGLDPTGVAITAAADPKDKQGIVIAATADDGETAREWATAMAEATKAYGLSKIGWLIDLEATKSAVQERRIEYLDSRIAEIQAMASSTADPTLKMEYSRTVTDLQLTKMSAEDLLGQSRLTRQGYLAYVSSTEAGPAAAVSSKGILLSNVLRGALVGLFIGALIAALLHNRRSAA